MKAAVVYGELDLRLKDREMPSIKCPDDVLIRVRAVGICGSDSAILRGLNPFVSYPRVMGHEFVGEVVEFGSDVRDLEQGEHVVIEPITYGGKSFACRRSMPNVSEDLKVNGVHVDGGMQEYIVIKSIQVHRIGKDIPWTTAVLCEPYTIGGNSTTRGGVMAGDTVLVQGAGPIGITILRVARAKGASVMVTDLVDSKLEFATECGASRVVNTKREDLEESVRDWTHGEMANVVLDAVGTPETFRACFNLTSVAGTIVVLGMTEKTTPVPQKPIMAKQLTICGTRLQAYQFEPIIHLMENGVIGDEGLVSHAFPFERIQDAFDLVFNHPEQARKVVLTFD